MAQSSKTECPNCRSNQCVYGRLEPSDADDAFSGHFYPLYIKQKTFWSVSEPRVDLRRKQKFYACYNCGHLWGKVNLIHFKEVIADCNWQGGEQIPPKPGRPYFNWVSAGIIFGLIVWITFMELIS